MDLSFYRGKKVLITGHTGFKGSWMCEVLLREGADVTGFSNGIPTVPGLFEVLGLQSRINSVTGDVRNLEALKEVFARIRPEIVIHMAAQPIVRESYRNPVYTYETNVMGTVNVLECIRLNPCVKSFVNVTTDKVYKNREWAWGYRENEELNGFDPYSNSKSCSELVTESYVNSFFSGGERPLAVSTCRAGNVIGGGDFAADRIIPDCIRAVERNQPIIVRNPFSIRPYQHVLEPVAAYLMIAKAQYENPELAGSYNVGPDETDCRTTGELVSLFCKEWRRQTQEEIGWLDQYDGGPHEASFLKLDCTRLKTAFGWHPRWSVEDAMEKIVEWTLAYRTGGSVGTVTEQQILDYLGGSY